jgi:hypothetical protein
VSASAAAADVLLLLLLLLLLPKAWGLIDSRHSVLSDSYSCHKRFCCCFGLGCRCRMLLRMFCSFIRLANACRCHPFTLFSCVYCLYDCTKTVKVQMDAAVRCYMHMLTRLHTVAQRGPLDAGGGIDSCHWQQHLILWWF